MGRKITVGSRVSRRAATKSATRKKCQTQTRGAAKRAAKTLAGKPRPYKGLAEWEKNLLLNHTRETIARSDANLETWERDSLRNSAVFSMMP